MKLLVSLILLGFCAAPALAQRHADLVYLRDHARRAGHVQQGKAVPAPAPAPAPVPPPPAPPQPPASGK
ncbi:MAG: hypothetical protein WCO11_02460 [Sphingomonadales bacterium]